MEPQMENRDTTGFRGENGSVPIFSEFQRLVDDILETGWKQSPVSATFAGIHKYDHELGECSREYYEGLIVENRRDMTRLDALDRDQLTPDELLDWQLLRNNTEAALRGLEEIRYWEKDPAGPVQLGLYGVFILAIREFAPLAQRAEAMLSRLRRVPRAIEQGKACLKDSPPVFTKVALGVADGGLAFYQGFVPALADQVPALKAEMLEASRKAVEAVSAYRQFLADEHTARSTGDYAIGRELFDFYLRVSHGLPYNADELVAIGNDVLQSTEADLTRLAQEIDPARKWWEIAAELKRDHPKAEELIDVYRAEMERARDFVREHHLVTMPEGERLELIWTPSFERSTLPYAAYMAPAPFEADQKGFFYVTPVNEALPPEKQEEQLQGHSRYSIPVTALHEGYPGHHLQLVWSNRVSSKVRRLLGTPVFAEGWALYCEELMYDQGFYSDPGVRLMQLKDQVWRGCRVLIDVGLHTQGMTYDQAVDMLVNRARLERVNAETEVNRYCSTPTQPMSYIIGKLQIVNLRREYEARMRGNGDLRQFHDRLLSFGTIPVEMVRQAMRAESGRNRR
jgi:uncharacterized protein (DUF885 family)